MPNTFSMAPRYVRDFVARTGYEPPERDVFDALSAKLDRLYRQPLPTTAGIALLGDARTAGRRARAALRARGLPDRARLVVTSPPYLRVLKYGYYNWLRHLAARLRRARRSTPRSTTPTSASRTSRSCATSSPTSGPALTDDGIAVVVIGDVEMDRGKPSTAGHRPRRARLGGGGAARRATGSPASCATRSPPTAR